MPQPRYLVALVLPVLIATLLACTGEAPAPDPTETKAPGAVAAPPALIPNTPELTATTATTAPTPVSQGLHSSQPPTDQETELSSLSEDELACIGEDPGEMLAALAGSRPSSMEEQAEFIRCLDDITVDRLFMATIIPVPLSEETSTCVQAGLDVIDPRAVMTAGLEGDPQTAMAGSMAAFSVSVACLNDEEWGRNRPSARNGTGGPREDGVRHGGPGRADGDGHGHDRGHERRGSDGRHRPVRRRAGNAGWKHPGSQRHQNRRRQLPRPCPRRPWKHQRRRWRRRTPRTRLQRRQRRCRRHRPRHPRPPW